MQGKHAGNLGSPRPCWTHRPLHPDFEVPTVEDGKHAGVIGVGGLLLARIPLEIVEERDEHFRGMTRNQMAAVDNDLAREQHPAMPINNPDRQSRVTFGGPQNED